jgi:hypothetical protein
MRFTIRDLFWLTALVAMGLAWWAESRWHDWNIKSAQLRKDYYNLMSDLARSEIQKAKADAALKEKQLTDALEQERDRVNKLEKSAAREPEASH